MTLTGSHRRRFYLRSTSVFSALEVFLYENALFKSTFDIDICFIFYVDFQIVIYTLTLFCCRQIPFFPLVKKDLTFIHLGNDSLVEGLVNFEKLRMIAKEVRHICSLAPVCCVSIHQEI